MLTPNDTSDKKFYYFLLFAFLFKLILLPFAQVTDADAVTRTLITLNWMENPEWMDTAIWAPFHFYYNAAILSVWNQPMYAPVLLNIIFSVLMLIPFYQFVKREFNAIGAFYATVFLFFAPPIFRVSFLGLAEIPFLFFIAVTINLLSKSIRENSFQSILLAGGSMTIAAGFRYDAWLLIGILGLTLLLFKEWKKAFLFGFIASIFPVVWMVSNYFATGDALHSIQGNYRYTLELIGVNENISWDAYLRRIWFFPFSVFIALGPPVFYLCFRHWWKSLFKRESNLWIWSLPFWLVLAFYLYNSWNGTLLLHHRFSGTLVLLILPFMALYYQEITVRKKQWSIFFLSFTIGLSFIYNMNGITPLPRLKDQSVVEFSHAVQQELKKESGLIIDFLGWENSYYIALDAGLRPKQIIFITGEKNAEIPYQDCYQILQNQSEGIIVLKTGSELDKMIQERDSKIIPLQSEELKIEVLSSTPERKILQWKK